MIMLNRCIRYFATAKLPHSNFVPDKYEGPSVEKVLAIRSENLVPCIKSHFRSPVLIHQGHMQWLFDHTGRRYLDMFGGIVTVSVGHCHPRVTDALKKQISTLWHTTNIYMHPKIHEYAEGLSEMLPDPLRVVYFVNSGSEANDMALLLARIHTGNADIIALRNAYHGGASSTISLTALNTWKFPMQTHNIHYAKNPDVYKGPFGGKNCRDSPIQTQRTCDCQGECQAADAYFDDVKEIIEYNLPKGRVAGFFAESIQGVGGSVQYPKGYLKKVYQLVRENGGVCIADEVQTGFGRTGTHFWGFENHGVIPDIVTMAKGIGNGFPLGAVVTTPEIAKGLTKALHFNTFGGNPMASAVGLEVLRVIKDEKLQENSLVVGTHFLNKLAELRDKYEIVGDVRGKGLMIGVEMVEHKKSKIPLAPKIFGDIWEECKENGVLFGAGGLKGNMPAANSLAKRLEKTEHSRGVMSILNKISIHRNVFRIKPPMCITKEDADFAISVLESAIQSRCSL